MSNPSTKVQTLSLKQFTVFADATFKFSPDINVIIGENATGKTHLMKIIYTLLKACENTHQRQISSNGDKFKEVFQSQLHGIFQIRHHKALARLGADRAEVLIDYANTHFHIQTGMDDFSIQYDPAQLPNPSSLIYLPAREFLSIFEGFIKAYNKGDLPFDETYYDLALALNAKPKCANKLGDVQPAIELLQKAIVGNNWDKTEIIKQDNGRFYFDLPEGYFDIHSVADGYRTLGTLLYLLRNGSFTKDSIFFWDEPEAKLNPKLSVEVARVLPILAKAGMQIFLATHDFALGYELSLLAEYPPASPIDIKFFSLYKPDRQSTLIVESGSTLADIDHNSILDEFATQHDRETDLFYNGRGPNDTD